MKTNFPIKSSTFRNNIYDSDSSSDLEQIKDKEIKIRYKRNNKDSDQLCIKKYTERIKKIEEELNDFNYKKKNIRKLFKNTISRNEVKNLEMEQKSQMIQDIVYGRTPRIKNIEDLYDVLSSGKKINTEELRLVIEDEIRIKQSLMEAQNTKDTIPNSLLSIEETSIDLVNENELKINELQLRVFQQENDINELMKEKQSLLKTIEDLKKEVVIANDSRIQESLIYSENSIKLLGERIKELEREIEEKNESNNLLINKNDEIEAKLQTCKEQITENQNNRKYFEEILVKQQLVDISELETEKYKDLEFQNEILLQDNNLLKEKVKKLEKKVLTQTDVPSPTVNKLIRVEHDLISDEVFFSTPKTTSERKYFFKKNKCLNSRSTNISPQTKLKSSESAKTPFRSHGKTVSTNFSAKQSINIISSNEDTLNSSPLLEGMFMVENEEYKSLKKSYDDLKLMYDNLEKDYDGMVGIIQTYPKYNEIKDYVELCESVMKELCEYQDGEENKWEEIYMYILILYDFMEHLNTENIKLKDEIFANKSMNMNPVDNFHTLLIKVKDELEIILNVLINDDDETNMVQVVDSIELLLYMIQNES